MKDSAVVKLTREQYYYLRIRYKRTNAVRPTTLVRNAMLEIVAMQAKKESISAARAAGVETEEDEKQ